MQNSIEVHELCTHGYRPTSKNYHHCDVATHATWVRCTSRYQYLLATSSSLLCGKVGYMGAMYSLVQSYPQKLSSLPCSSISRNMGAIYILVLFYSRPVHRSYVVKLDTWLRCTHQYSFAGGNYHHCDVATPTTWVRCTSQYSPTHDKFIAAMWQS